MSDLVVKNLDNMHEVKESHLPLVHHKKKSYVVSISIYINGTFYYVPHYLWCTMHQ